MAKPKTKERCYQLIIPIIYQFPIENIELTQNIIVIQCKYQKKKDCLKKIQEKKIQVPALKYFNQVSEQGPLKNYWERGTWVRVRSTQNGILLL